VIIISLFGSNGLVEFNKPVGGRNKKLYVTVDPDEVDKEDRLLVTIAS